MKWKRIGTRYDPLDIRRGDGRDSGLHHVPAKGATVRQDVLEFLSLTAQAAALIDRICTTVESKDDIARSLRNAQCVAMAQDRLPDLLNESRGVRRAK